MARVISIKKHSAFGLSGIWQKWIVPSTLFGSTYFATVITVMCRFKKDLKLEIHLHKAFFSGNQFLDSLHKSFLNQTSLDLRKKKWTFLNQDFTVLAADLDNQKRCPYFLDKIIQNWTLCTTGAFIDFCLAGQSCGLSQSRAKSIIH